MINIIILFLSIIAIIFLLQQLIKAKRSGRFIETIRDLFVVILALAMTLGIFYIIFRLVIRFIL
ncbi:MAG: hypothetical protein EVB00_02005 [SAR86 cluster bacterium]|jgi:hypothetical protein|uniref:Uncharacterized protein n=1 Tax=SAR86 cluster bacterium TaxID=2030880 RepID=A0A520M949_9GAMM|nr:MAG: hypothetical protein EVB00_02005 [SAR86 cluster bacterium]